MDNQLISFAITVFIGFFAIMNPIANTPIFIGLVGHLSKQEQKKIAFNASLTALIIVLSFLIIGKYIFEVFGITIPAFKITGGILLFYIGFEMLQSKSSSIMSNNNQQESDDSVAISPLAIPILAGPGTIVTGMNFVEGVDFLKIGIVAAIFILMIILTYIFFVMGEKIEKKLGKGIIQVISKLMGLIIAILGVGMITQGIKLTFNLH